MELLRLPAAAAGLRLVNRLQISSMASLRRTHRPCSRRHSFSIFEMTSSSWRITRVSSGERPACNSLIRSIDDLLVVQLAEDVLRLLQRARARRIAFARCLAGQLDSIAQLLRRLADFMEALGKVDAASVGDRFAQAVAAARDPGVERPEPAGSGVACRGAGACRRPFRAAGRCGARAARVPFEALGRVRGALPNGCLHWLRRAPQRRPAASVGRRLECRPSGSPAHPAP